MYISGKIGKILACFVVLEALMTFPAMAAGGTNGFWDRAQAAGAELWNTAKEKAPGVWDKTKETAGDLYDKAKEKAPEVYDKAKDGLESAGNKISDFRAGQEDQFWGWVDHQMTPSDNTETIKTDESTADQSTYSNDTNDGLATGQQTTSSDSTEAHAPSVDVTTAPEHSTTNNDQTSTVETPTASTDSTAPAASDQRPLIISDRASSHGDRREGFVVTKDEPEEPLPAWFYLAAMICLLVCMAFLVLGFYVYLRKEH